MQWVEDPAVAAVPVVQAQAPFGEPSGETIPSSSVPPVDEGCMFVADVAAGYLNRLSQTIATGFSSLPIPEIVMCTESLASSVKESCGTIPAPVSSTAPSGNCWERNRYSTSSSNRRLMFATRVSPVNTGLPARRISSWMLHCRATSSFTPITIHGPTAQDFV